MEETIARSGEAVRATPDVAADASHWGMIPIRRWAAAAWAWSNRRAATVLRHSEPRVMLFTGSVLILLTLFFTVALGIPGSRTGLEYVRGDGRWAGVLDSVTSLLWGGEFPHNFSSTLSYSLPLSFSAFTLAFVLAACLRPKVLRKPRLSTWLFAIAGTLSLFLTVDFFSFCGGAIIVLVVDPWAHPLLILAAGLLLLVLGGCLRWSFIRRQKWFVWLLAAGGICSLTGLVSFSLRRLHFEWAPPDDIEGALCLAPFFLCWLVPVVLWYGFGLSLRAEMRAQWPSLRARLIAVYVPTIGIDCLLLLCLAVPNFLAGIWGLPIFLVGVHLLALGYMRLAQEANATPSTAQILNH